MSRNETSEVGHAHLYTFTQNINIHTEDHIMVKDIPQEFDENGRYRQGPFQEGSLYRNMVRTHERGSKCYVLSKTQETIS